MTMPLEMLQILNYPTPISSTYEGGFASIAEPSLLYEVTHHTPQTVD